MAFLVLTIQFNRIPENKALQQELIQRTVERTENSLNTWLGNRPAWNMQVLDVTTNQAELIPMDDGDRRKVLERLERELENPTDLERLLAARLTRRG